MLHLLYCANKTAVSSATTPLHHDNLSMPDSKLKQPRPQKATVENEGGKNSMRKLQDAS
jgi:hypothetical protein